MSAINDTPTRQEVTSAAMKAIKTGSGSDDVTAALADEFGKHFMSTPDLQPEIKHEPPEDINDIHCGFPVSEENSNGGCGTDSPKIRLTPTIKLMATPNPVDPKRKFACPYENCTKSYGKSSHLRSHLTWHTGIKPFVCQEPNCGKGFTRSDELNRHVRTHTGEKPFECIQCTKKFSRSDHLTKHLATHAKQMQNSVKRILEDPEVTTDTKKVFMEMQTPPNPVNFNDGMHFMASLIGGSVKRVLQSLPEPENLTEEQTMAHSPIRIKLERPDHSGEYHVVTPPLPSHKPARCNAATSESDDEMPPELIVPVSTMICPPSPEIKTEPSDDAIMPEANAPPMSAVGGTGGRMPQFEECVADGKFNPERPFHCNQCIKCFKRQDDLNRHLRTHSGEKPFACGECERRFMRRDHLTKHLKTHTKLR